MLAIQIEATGSADVLKTKDLPIPTPGPGEALIRIEASGVNFIDTYFREGRYPATLPLTLGQEAAGVVESIGPDVDTIKPGDRVAWCGIPGTYAQYATAPAARLVHVPDPVTSQQACAAILQGMTAHYLLHSTYSVQPGDSILIHAGAGGTGLLLTQMAKKIGAHVITTVSTPQKEKLSREAGADDVIQYTQTNFVDEVKRLTSNVGLPVVYDSVGKTTFEGSLACLRPRGTMVLFGGASGPVPPFDLIRLSTIGSLYITRPTLKDYVLTPTELAWRAGEVLSAVANHALKLRIEHTYPLADAAQAHRDLESRKTTGKLLLLP